MNIVVNKVSVEEIKLGDVFVFDDAYKSMRFKNAIYAQARNKGFDNPIFNKEDKKNKVSLTVVGFKPIKPRVK